MGKNIQSKHVHLSYRPYVPYRPTTAKVLKITTWNLVCIFFSVKEKPYKFVWKSAKVN